MTEPILKPLLDYCIPGTQNNPLEHIVPDTDKDDQLGNKLLARQAPWGDDRCRHLIATLSGVGLATIPQLAVLTGWHVEEVRECLRHSTLNRQPLFTCIGRIKISLLKSFKTAGKFLPTSDYWQVSKIHHNLLKRMPGIVFPRSLKLNDEPNTAPVKDNSHFTWVQFSHGQWGNVHNLLAVEFTAAFVLASQKLRSGSIYLPIFQATLRESWCWMGPVEKAYLAALEVKLGPDKAAKSSLIKRLHGDVVEIDVPDALVIQSFLEGVHSVDQNECPKAVRLEIEHSRKTKSDYFKLWSRLPKGLAVCYIAPSDKTRDFLKSISENFRHQIHIAELDTNPKQSLAPGLTAWINPRSAFFNWVKTRKPADVIQSEQLKMLGRGDWFEFRRSSKAISYRG